MKNLFKKLRFRPSRRDVTRKKFDLINRTTNKPVSGRTPQLLKLIMASNNFRIDMPATLPSDEESYFYKDPDNPLELHIAIESQVEERIYPPIIFQTSLQEILAFPLQSCPSDDLYDEGLGRIADELRKLAGDIDKTLFRKTKQHRRGNNVLTLV